MIATNVTVTGPDHKKSEAIAEHIANHLEATGFTNLNFINPPPLEPLNLKTPMVKRSMSLLEAIQEKNPGIFDEPVNIRAVQVQELDQHIPRDYDTTQHIATYHVTDEGVGRTMVAYAETGHPTSPVIGDNPVVKSVMERALQKEVTRLMADPSQTFEPNYYKAEKELVEEGKIPKESLAATAIEIDKMRNDISNLFETISDETGFQQSGISPEVWDLVDRDRIERIAVAAALEHVEARNTAVADFVAKHVGPDGTVPIELFIKK